MCKSTAPLLVNTVKYFCYIIWLDGILHADDGLERQINELKTSVSHLQIQNGKCSIDPSIHLSDSVFDLCIHMCNVYVCEQNDTCRWREYSGSMGSANVSWQHTLLQLCYNAISMISVADTDVLATTTNKRSLPYLLKTLHIEFIMPAMNPCILVC